jgi:hypothetical protein
MLTRTHKILIGLLALQALLVALMFLRDDAPALVKDRPLLAGFDAAKVTRVRLFGASADKPGVDLVKRGEAWIVASHHDYPADATKVKGLLEPLAKIAGGAPIATSATRHKQLRVADAEFERKIVLDVEGAGEQALHIGGAVGARRTAIRVGGDDVYAATDVSTFVAEPAGFVTTRYVDIPKAEIERVAIRRDPTMIELARVPAAAPAAGAGSAGAGGADAPAETWSATIDGADVTRGLAPGESLDTDAIDRIIGQLAALDLRAPADPRRDANQPTAVISIHKKGTEQSIVLDVIADGDNYWVRQRERPHAVLVDRTLFSDAVLVDRDKLVRKPPPPPARGPRRRCPRRPSRRRGADQRAGRTRRICQPYTSRPSRTRFGRRSPNALPSSTRCARRPGSSITSTPTWNAPLARWTAHALAIAASHAPAGTRARSASASPRRPPR